MMETTMSNMMETTMSNMMKNTTSNTMENTTLSMMTNTTLDLMANTTLNMTETTTPTPKIKMNESPVQDLYIDWLDLLSIQMLCFGTFYFLLPWCTTSTIRSVPVTLKTKLVTFAVLWMKAFTIMYHCYLLTSCDDMRGVLHAIVHEFCSCFSLILPVALFVHFWNPTLMNPIATSGDRLMIYVVMSTLLMEAQQSMVFELESSYTYTVYKIPVTFYLTVWILAFVYISSWTKLVPTREELDKEKNSKRAFSVFDYGSIMTIFAINMSILVVAVVAIQDGPKNLNVLYFFYEMLRLMFVLFVLFVLCPKINAAIKNASKLPITSVSSSDELEVVKVALNDEDTIPEDREQDASEDRK